MTSPSTPLHSSARSIVVAVVSCLFLASGIYVTATSASATDKQPRTVPVVPTTSTQLIVGIVSGWNDKDVTLHRFSRKPGKAWVEDRPQWSGRLGAQGVAWGRGLHPHEPIPDGAADKVEGDRRAPAGVFRLGTVFGYPVDVPRQPATKYIQVTDRDLLVEDPKSPLYNTHVRLDHPATSQWEIQNRMTLDDPAHELKVFVEHNTDPAPVPGKGSAILLHITRPSERSYTSGCTAMDRSAMYETVAWLDAARHPLYALLPQNVYDQVAESWGLPKQLVSNTRPATIPVVTKRGSATKQAPPTTRQRL